MIDNIASHDKVYFFSSKLSFGGASLFTIERINLKSRHNESFTIEVIYQNHNVGDHQGILADTGAEDCL